MYRIAIQPDEISLPRGRGTQSFSKRWVQRLTEMGHEPVLIDANKDDFFEQVAACDGFMWTLVQATYSRHFGRRVLAALEHATHIPVFPSWKTIWHFDDKIGQYYLLRAAGFPTPRTWAFWYRHEAVEFCRTAKYPMVLKLASGIMSRNVEMVRNFEEAEYWINRMFGAGVVSLEKPQLGGIRGARQRLRDAARLLAKGIPPGPSPFAEVQRSYFFAQEFLAGNEFDHRVTVVGNRAFAFRRHNRPNDFRASGSGRIDWDQSKIDPAMVRLAFGAQRKLGAQSLAIDGLYRNGEPVVGEISYIYEGWAVATCPGHWELHGDAHDGRLEWVEGSVRPEDAILEDFLALVGRRKGEARPARGAGARRPQRAADTSLQLAGGH
jgi:glutathione synthase/RimK-type ligase-like ATP-grasp enzyme